MAPLNVGVDPLSVVKLNDLPIEVEPEEWTDFGAGEPPPDWLKDDVRLAKVNVAGIVDGIEVVVGAGSGIAKMTKEELEERAAGVLLAVLSEGDPNKPFVNGEPISVVPDLVGSVHNGVTVELPDPVALETWARNLIEAGHSDVTYSKIRRVDRFTVIRDETRPIDPALAYEKAKVAGELAIGLLDYLGERGIDVARLKTIGSVSKGVANADSDVDVFLTVRTVEQLVEVEKFFGYPDSDQKFLDTLPTKLADSPFFAKLNLVVILEEDYVQWEATRKFPPLMVVEYVSSMWKWREWIELGGDR
jgi:hypothetical protein